MKILLHTTLVLVLLGTPPFGASQTAPVQTAPDPAVYVVAYVEVVASARGTAAAAFGAYRDTSRAQDGYGRVDVFEQVGRPGHFAVFEAWRDQKAFDDHEAIAKKPLIEKLQPIRVSGYDQRPYKTLAVGAAPPRASRDAISVVSHVDVTPNSQVVEILKRVAEASRREAGNVRFDVVQHTMRANHFTVVATWRNQGAFDAHVAAAHTKQYRDELQPLTGSPLDERVYKAVE